MGHRQQNSPLGFHQPLAKLEAESRASAFPSDYPLVILEIKPGRNPSVYLFLKGENC